MLASRFGDSSPTDGRPSVRKSTTGRRFLGLSKRNASSRAASMFVPPSATRPSIHACACSRARPRAGTHSRLYTRTALENATSRKRSSGDSDLSNWCRAWRACSIFSPDIDPETSITTVRSRGSTASTFRPGESVSMKYPSSPIGRCIAMEIPTASPAIGRKTDSRPTISSSMEIVMRASSRSTSSVWVGENGSRNSSQSSTTISKRVSTPSGVIRSTSPAPTCAPPRTLPAYTN